VNMDGNEPSAPPAQLLPASREGLLSLESLMQQVAGRVSKYEIIASKHRNYATHMQRN
jgi:hypothetical protein